MAIRRTCSKCNLRASVEIPIGQIECNARRNIFSLICTMEWDLLTKPLRIGLHAVIWNCIWRRDGIFISCAMICRRILCLLCPFGDVKLLEIRYATHRQISIELICIVAILFNSPWRMLHKFALMRFRPITISIVWTFSNGPPDNHRQKKHFQLPSTLGVCGDSLWSLLGRKHSTVKSYWNLKLILKHWCRTLALTLRQSFPAFPYSCNHLSFYIRFFSQFQNHQNGRNTIATCWAKITTNQTDVTHSGADKKFINTLSIAYTVTVAFSDSKADTTFAFNKRI